MGDLEGMQDVGQGGSGAVRGGRREGGVVQGRLG